MTLTEPRAGGTDATIADVVAGLRNTFWTGRTRPLAWRLEQLDALHRLLVEREADLVAALAQDLGRGSTEAWLEDIAPLIAEIKYARKHLASWVRPQRVRASLPVQPGRAWVQPEPLGVVGIIGPWNYPVYLILAPLVGALAAGNCAVLKPSEHTPTVSATLAKLVSEYLDPDAVATVQGAAAESLELIDQGLDHICFTGSPEIGKVIMAAAAKHLTPVTLELGGKCPVIVAEDASVRAAARRIALGKAINSGQTCVAPDYVLVHRDVRDKFLAELNRAIDKYTPERDLPLVHQRRAQRIAELVAGARGRLIRGGHVDAAAHRAEMTVIVDPDESSELMSEEIFGPVLPVVTVDSLDEAIAHVTARPKPLAVYVFTGNPAVEKRVVNEISSGGTVVNHLVLHLLAPGLPFGGVGNSGMGAYHGRWGFDTFSHRKAVLRKPIHPDPWFQYPPYTKLKERLLRAVF